MTAADPPPDTPADPDTRHTAQVGHIAHASLTPHTPHTPLWRDPEFRRGAHDMTGIAVGIAAWGLVTGVAMAKSGMT